MPDVKLIVVLRDPVERCVVFLHFCEGVKIGTMEWDPLKPTAQLNEKITEYRLLPDLSSHYSICEKIDLLEPIKAKERTGFKSSKLLLIEAPIFEGKNKAKPKMLIFFVLLNFFYLNYSVLLGK